MQASLVLCGLQKELQLSPEVRQDLKLARRAYLTQLGFIIRERQDLVRSLNDNMPTGGNHSSTSTRQAAPAALIDLRSQLIWPLVCCKVCQGPLDLLAVCLCKSK